MCIMAGGAAAGHGMMAKLCAPAAGIQPAGTQARSASAQAKSASVKRRAQRVIAAALRSTELRFHPRIVRFDAFANAAVPRSQCKRNVRRVNPVVRSCERPRKCFTIISSVAAAMTSKAI
jgi:hypothetical protein